MIAALVSGGVDSSVALALLKKKHTDLKAYYLKIWLEDDLADLGECPWEEDLSYVKKVCEQLDVCLEVLDLQKEYWDSVISYALNQIKKGLTPNPDMMCNAKVKFGAFLDIVEVEQVATGHYADVETKGDGFYLKRVRDPVKDQTYFLAHLNQTQLQKALFPLGPYTKTEVRQLAQDFDLVNKDRKDSQGICFLGKIKYDDFIRHYFGEKKGPIVNFDTGEQIGEHKGCWFYTLGQRRGIGSGLNHGPWYVVKKDMLTNTVFISNTYHQKKRNTFFVTDVNWIPKEPDLSSLKVKVRHGTQLYTCSVEKQNDLYKVTIDGNDQGIAPGQFAVFYDETYCYGGGTIVEP